MRFALGNDVFNVFGSQMASDQRPKERRTGKKGERTGEEKLNFSEMLQEYTRVAAGGVQI